ncbi:hypothetical protein GLOTRDRAFT_131862 [Gloeophyllum trabeum ATCC 11539]|uniref:BHLH domain-containing protein n=1 Tax=Gloeophyllum trabeum (strain ATCC 11539 / FP-39264 / Madison 617) TaxID=670483 RepID=S7PZA7_GLOTA|nr:uncharacterized protein GLOTRDRAFT_131862 [Gloeophyllum trabeum ATCC 11539]EPQ52627.1 hypothetical protein GLOTRDRAFT_131862 [Gloeophyllum trabeum ATCC 11539]
MPAASDPQLLSAGEAHAFQSFLAAVDDGLAPEWHMYASGGAHGGGGGAAMAGIEVPAGREALAKATKDLMALDHRAPPPPQQQQQQQHQQPQQPSRHATTDAPSYAHEPHYSFGYVHSRPPARAHSSSAAPPHTLHPLPAPAPSALPASASASRPPAPRRPPKRPSTSSSTSSSTTTTTTTTTSTNAKRRRASPSPKPALLTPSQKKANHIQSEQKRRANIRRGYEALCDAVPALRAAIAREEAEERREKGKARRRGKGREGREAEAEAAERADGRAGPRSENIVLQKTIDYITALLDERSALLTRLQHARARLPPSHPALHPPSAPPPLWEREWTGGTGDGEEEAGAGE